MLVMNGQHTEFNRLLGLGNELLQQRQGLVNVPLRLPQATLDDKQQSALTKTERELALSRLKGEEKERARLGYAADDLGFVGDSYQEARQRYISNALEAWRNNEANKPKSRGGNQRRKKRKTVFPATEAAERATGTGGSEYRAGEAEVPDCAGRTENPDGDAEAGTAA
ncbi:Tail length tape measure protein [Escherichia coli]|nr:Tail length tape measure protein [Escherichia coli]